MKKNKMMRIASVLLVAVLLSTCAISGTFAKYTTVSEGSDSARVAKWGFNNAATIDFENLFTDSDLNVADGDDATQNIIAPGTSGNVSFKFTNSIAGGTPEVAYTFAVDTTGSDCATAIQNSKNITWRLTESATAPTDWSNADTWTKLIADIKALSGDASGSEDYAVGDPLPTMVNKTYYVHWNWAFENTDDRNDNDNYNDSDLGNTAVGSDLIVTLKVKISATQKD